MPISSRPVAPPRMSLTASPSARALTTTRSARRREARLDRTLLLTLLEKFDGGPVGLDTLAAAVGEDRGTLEDVVEPYLIYQGFLDRTQRGRVATRIAHEYFGIPQR